MPNTFNAGFTGKNNVSWTDFPIAAGTDFLIIRRRNHRIHVLIVQPA
jgi:hypothetical protein